MPETIGSICYLTKYKKILKKNVICGFNISCVGDEKNYSIISSKSGNTLADIALLDKIKGKKNLKIIPF